MLAEQGSKLDQYIAQAQNRDNQPQQPNQTNNAQGKPTEQTQKDYTFGYHQIEQHKKARNKAMEIEANTERQPAMRARKKPNQQTRPVF